MERRIAVEIDGQQLEAVHGIDENICCLTLVETVEFYKAVAAASMAARSRGSG